MSKSRRTEVDHWLLFLKKFMISFSKHVLGMVIVILQDTGNYFVRRMCCNSFCEHVCHVKSRYAKSYQCFDIILPLRNVHYNGN